MVIAYTQYDEIWFWKNGESKLLVNTSVDLPIMDDYGRIALSDDGRIIAYIDNEYEIFVINTDGRNKTRLVPHDVINKAPISELAGKQGTIILPYRLQWLPQSHTLLVNTLGWLITSLYQLYGELYMVNFDTGNTEKYSWNTGGYFYPSPDGKKIGYVDLEEIGLMDDDIIKQEPLIEYQLIYISEYL